MFDTMFDGQPATGLSNDELQKRVIGYASQIAAMTSKFLDHVAEFEARKMWVGEGVRSCAHWLSWFTGLSHRTAQDYVRVARALRELPILHQMLATGRLSYSKVRALTRVADLAGREEELARFAESASAGQVELLVTSLRDVDQGERATNRAVESRCSGRWNADGTYTVTGTFNPLDAAHLLAGLVRCEYERTRIDGDPDLPAEPVDPIEDPKVDVEPHKRRDLWRNVPTNFASALVAMADTAIDCVGMPEVAPGAEILINETTTTTADDDAPATASDDAGREAHLDSGPALDDAQRDEARCGATVRTVGHHNNPKGPTLWWGRKRRVPNAALVRVITMRDRTCRHPGCGRTRFLHIHHVKLWSQHGTTDPDNLILLCSEHHRALHNGAFTIQALGLQQFQFVDARGRTLLDAPPTRAPGGWTPAPNVAGDGVVPKQGGKLDLHYAVEVLYATWAWKARHAQRATTELRATAA